MLNFSARFLIDRANYVWSANITYISMKKGFIYLVAIIVMISISGLPEVIILSKMSQTLKTKKQ